MTDCIFCDNVRISGWSNAGPIPCPSCCDGMLTVELLTLAWREQRTRVKALEAGAESLTVPIQALRTAYAQHGRKVPRGERIRLVDAVRDYLAALDGEVSHD